MKDDMTFDGVTLRAAAAADSAAADLLNKPLAIDPQTGEFLPGQGVGGGVDFAKNRAFDLTFVLSTNKSWDQYKNLISAVEKQATRVILGKPVLPYIVRGGVLYRTIPRLIPIGSAFRGIRDNRLRKFVRRGGLLVEVRARGRSGSRSLQEAVQAAMKPELRGVKAERIFIDDMVSK